MGRRRDRKPRARGWYERSVDPPGTERFWDGEKWGPQPRMKRGVEQPEPKRKTRRVEASSNPAEEEAADARDAGEAGEVELEQSSVWARIAARAVDMAIVFLPWSLVWNRAFEIQTGFVDGEAVASTEINTALLWASVAVVIVYEVAFVRWWGATPGKRLVGLKIVDRDEMERPGIVRAIFRSTPLMLLISILLAPLLMIACIIAIMVDKQDRSFFDFAGGTYVVLDPNRTGGIARQSRRRR